MTRYPMPSLYQELVSLGMQIDSHESDLYVPVNEQTSAVIRKCQRIAGITVFKSELDGNYWYDIPFAYEPFWSARCG
jgi:hypothetical protein